MYGCIDKLQLYVKKEHKLPSCLNNMQAMLAMTPILNGFTELQSAQGTGMAFALLAGAASEFNCSISKVLAGIQ